MSRNFVKKDSEQLGNLAKAKLAAVSKKWRGLFWATRTRILFCYVLIITFIFIVSIPAFRTLLFARVDARVPRELMEKMETFNQLIENEAETELDEAEAEIQASNWVNSQKPIMGKLP